MRVAVQQLPALCPVCMCACLFQLPSLPYSTRLDSTLCVYIINDGRSKDPNFPKRNVSQPVLLALLRRYSDQAPNLQPPPQSNPPEAPRVFTFQNPMAWKHRYHCRRRQNTQTSFKEFRNFPDVDQRKTRIEQMLLPTTVTLFLRCAMAHRSTVEF